MKSVYYINSIENLQKTKGCIPYVQLTLNSRHQAHERWREFCRLLVQHPNATKLVAGHFPSSIALILMISELQARYMKQMNTKLPPLTIWIIIPLHYYIILYILAYFIYYTIIYYHEFGKHAMKHRTKFNGTINTTFTHAYLFNNDHKINRIPKGSQIHCCPYLLCMVH